MYKNLLQNTMIYLKTQQQCFCQIFSNIGRSHYVSINIILCECYYERKSFTFALFIVKHTQKAAAI